MCPCLLTFIPHLLGTNLGCGFIPGCEKCNDGLICKKCRTVFIPVEYERSKNTIIRCIRSCPMGYNITSRKGYPKICVRTELGKFLGHMILRLERNYTETWMLWEKSGRCSPMGYEISSRETHPRNPGIHDRRRQESKTLMISDLLRLPISILSFQFWHSG